MAIEGHKIRVRRLGKSGPSWAGPWEAKCECGHRVVANGQRVVHTQMSKHIKEMTKLNEDIEKDFKEEGEFLNV